MKSCIFCQVVANSIPSHTIFEDGTTRAFLDIYPQTDGAVMVIHKRHEETITGYSKAELADIFDTVKRVAGAVEKAYGTKILTIGINHGEEAGVHHLHVHVLPRFPGDGGGIIQSLPARKPVDTLERVAEKLRGCL